jgi:hypothetical protein
MTVPQSLDKVVKLFIKIVKMNQLDCAICSRSINLKVFKTSIKKYIYLLTTRYLILDAVEIDGDPAP